MKVVIIMALALDDLPDDESDWDVCDSVFFASAIDKITSSPYIDLWLNNAVRGPRDLDYEAERLEPDPYNGGFRLPCKNSEFSLCLDVQGGWLPQEWWEMKGVYVCRTCDMMAPEVRERYNEKSSE